MKALLRAAVFGVVRVVAQLSRLRRRRARVRSLWAGSPIINFVMQARAEEQMVERADTLVYETYFITQQFRYDLSKWVRMPLVGLFVPYVVFLWAVFRYDRFHFFCDRGLLPPEQAYCFHPKELPLLRSLGKQVFLWTYGADVRTVERTRALGEFHCCVDCPAPGIACVCEDALQQRNHAASLQDATAVFAMGDMAEYTPGSRNDLYFWPVDLEAEDGARYAPVYPAADTAAPLRVVHAPNHREFKGTRHLLEAVERLREEGVEIDLQLVERVPNREALELYRSADVIFDQCIIGFHGYLAQEAMALGKAVMCFIRKPEEYLLAPDECPIVDVAPATIAARLRELAGDRQRVRDLGEQGRRYIERHHTIAAFAERLGRVYAEIGAA